MAASESEGRKGKKFDFKKYKWWIFGGGGVLVLLFLAMRRQSSASTSNSAQTTAQQSGIDPATGYLYGSAADLAALSGSSEGVPDGGGAGAAGTTNNYYYNVTGTATTGTAGTSTVLGTTGSPPQKPGGAGLRPASSSEFYTVQPSDTLAGIASKIPGTNAGAIYNANRGVIAAGGAVHPGQRLAIPTAK